MGRVHVDYYDAFAPGLGSLSPGQAAPQGFELRRARLELAGEFFQTWQWQVGAELAPSTDDNVAATTSSLACKVNGTTGTQTCTPQANPVDSPSVKPAPTDVFINYAGSPLDEPRGRPAVLSALLARRNRISDNTTAFLERALVIRNIAAPLQRDIGAMFWGESPDRVLYYSAGVFNGDGPNRPNVDNRYDFAGRAFVRPLAKTHTGSSRWAQIGFSIHTGSRDQTKVGYDMPAMTTAEGFAFWKPTYTDSFGRLIHILPSATQEAFGSDLYVPIGNFDFTGEFIYANYHTREAVDGYQLSPFTERLGALSGWGLYAQVGYWLIGDHGEIIGYPELRPADPRRPHAGPAAARARASGRRASGSAIVQVRGSFPRGRSGFEDAGRRGRRDLVHPGHELLGHASPAGRGELRILRATESLASVERARGIGASRRSVLSGPHGDDERFEFFGERMGRGRPSEGARVEREGEDEDLSERPRSRGEVVLVAQGDLAADGGHGEVHLGAEAIRPIPRALEDRRQVGPRIVAHLPERVGCQAHLDGLQDRATPLPPCTWRSFPRRMSTSRLYWFDSNVDNADTRHTLSGSK